MSQKKYIYFTNLLIGLVALLAGPSLSESKENDVLNFKSSTTKLWLWPQSSQIYFLDSQTKSSLILYFYYNRDKTQLEGFEHEAVGLPDLFQNPETQKQNLESILRSIDYGDNLSVFLEGPRQVDPLGPQPTENTELYNKGLWSQGLHKNNAPASGNRFLNFIRQRFSGGKQPQHQAVFTEISFSQMRGIINSKLTQDQIDFEIFREMILNLVRNTPPGEGFQKPPPQSLSCKSLL